MESRRYTRYTHVPFQPTSRCFRLSGSLRPSLRRRAAVNYAVQPELRPGHRLPAAGLRRSLGRQLLLADGRALDHRIAAGRSRRSPGSCTSRWRRWPPA